MAKLAMRPQMTRLMKGAIASFKESWGLYINDQQLNKDFVEQSDAHPHISAPTSHEQVA